MQAEYKAYQPITNIKETTQIGVNALSQQQQAVQNENNARQQRLKELINAPLEAGQSIQNIFDSQESAILKNYEFSEGIEKNNFLDQIEKIDLDNSIPAIEKANRKQALSDGYKQARQIRRDNLKANNNFLLGKSQMDLAKYDEMDKMFFNSLENEFAKNRIALENQEKTQNRENVIKGLSSLSSPQSVYRNLDTIIKDINSDPTLAPIQKKGLIKEAGAKADKAAFDLRKANFLNTAYQGNPELGLQATRNEIGKLQNERYQPNLQNRGERIEELLNLEYKIQGMLNKQNNIKVVDNLNVSITESGETIQLKIQNTPEYKEAIAKGDIERVNQLENLGRQVEKEIQEDPVKYLQKQKGFMNMYQRQQEFNLVGLGDKSVMTQAEAKTFQNTYNNIGIGEVKRNNITLTPQEQFQEAIKTSKNLMQGDNSLLKKQANLELNGLQAIAVNMEIDDNPYREQILGYMIKQNENKGKSPAIYDETQIKAKKANFINDGGYGSYLYLTNPQLAEKYAKAGIDIEVYSHNDSKGDKILASDLGQVLKPDYEYKISSDATTILEINTTKYDANKIEKQVNTVKRDIPKYFNFTKTKEELKNMPAEQRAEYERNIERIKQKLFGGGKGIVAKTNDNEEIEFYFTSQISGQKDIFIGAMSFNNLPAKETQDRSFTKIKENINPVKQPTRYQNLFPSE